MALEAAVEAIQESAVESIQERSVALEVQAETIRVRSVVLEVAVAANRSVLWCRISLLSDSTAFCGPRSTS